MSINTGGPAFPSHHFDLAEGEHGMTLRDWFAGMAMQGDLASMVDPTGQRCGLQQDLTDYQLVKLSALYYRMADAMLKQREVSNGS